MSFLAVTAGATLVGSGYKIYDSARKNSQANKIEAANKRPIYNKPKEIGDAYNVATSEVGDTTLQDFATDSLGQNEANGIDAILKSGGKADFGVIHGTYGTQLKGMLATLAMNRDQKIAAYNNAAYNLAKSKDTEFQYNQDAPFKDAKQQEGLLKQQAEQDKMDAINTITSTAVSLATANIKPGQYGSKNTSTGITIPDSGVRSIDLPDSGDLRRPSPTIGNAPTLQNRSGGLVESQPGSFIIDHLDEWGNPVYK